MTVLAFHRQPRQLGWNRSELETIATAFSPAVGAGEASGWVVAETERGDPQVYLLGPNPDQDCILSISRLGRDYIVEDGTGGLLSERGCLLLLAEQLRLLMRRRTSALVARIGLVWIAWRKAAEEAEEQVEPMMAEPIEIISHLVPLAMVA